MLSETVKEGLAPFVDPDTGKVNLLGLSDERMEAFFALEDINLRLIPFREGSVKFVCSIDWK